MKFSELTPEIRPYRNALTIERLVSGPTLFRSERLLKIVTVAVLCVWVILFLFGDISFWGERFPALSLISLVLVPVLGALCGLFFVAWMVLFLLRSFYASSYFSDLPTVVPEKPLRVLPVLRYEVAEIISTHADPLLAFFSSRFGFSLSRRLGISAEGLGTFLQGRPEGITWNAFDVKEAAESEPVTLKELAEALVRVSDPLRRFLETNAVTTDDFVGAAAWVSRIEEHYKRYLRWWGRDALGRIPGIGKDWAYGETAILERYATEINEHSTLDDAASERFGAHEEEEIERILSRRRESNALLIGDEGIPKLSIPARLARRIQAGTVLPPLEHKRIFVLDGGAFASRFKERAAFEDELVKLFSEAARAGNIILVVNRLERFLPIARALGADIFTILDPFLSSPNIQIIAIAETGFFHEVLERDPKIQERFERVLVSSEDPLAVLGDLLDEALRIEGAEGVFFTYGAVRAVSESAERYFPEGVMPDKAIDLLEELAPKAKAAGKRAIMKEDVFELISRKTGIAVGGVTGEEKEKLLRLEETLHERVVGQDAAVAAISGALRRARAGVRNQNRPIGSFLFLGPTGVGKTETTKALAQAFFGDEKNIIRFDMSEYQTPDALSRLIGTFESGKVGTLATKLREKPYGVLLLDEFEKTNRDIHDLFLQILDEGFFADASGKRVNARNLMIIATSNAGSDRIWTALQEGKPADKDSIVNDIISRGIFRPEFLNRFDGVILFHPLSPEHLRSIAKLQLERLAKRLTEKGLTLSITDALLDFLVSVGQDPKFGARPMNRAIQEKVEQKIADKLLRGELHAGDTVEFTAVDLK